MAEQPQREEDPTRFTERLLIPNEPLTPQQFAQILIDKHIPTTYDQSVQAATAILEAKPPEFFLNRLARGFNFIGKESFDTNLEKMAIALNEKVHEDPFHYIYFPVSRSSHWIYEQLCGLGMKQAASKISTGEGLRVPPKEIRGKTDLYIIEDWFISGGHIQNQILDPVWEVSPDLHVPRIHAYVLYASAYAEKRLKENYVDVWVADSQRIPLLEDVLTPKDMDFLNEIGSVLPRGKGEIGSRGNTLTIGWWCIPDNIPEIFTNHQSRFMLIEPKSFTQPY